MGFTKGVVYEVEKGYFPKIGVEKTFDVFSQPNLLEEQSLAGALTLVGRQPTKEEDGEDAFWMGSRYKVWSMSGNLDEVNIEFDIRWDDYKMTKRFSNTKYDWYRGEATVKDISFEGSIWFNPYSRSDYDRYQFEIERIMVHGKPLSKDLRNRFYAGVRIVDELKTGGLGRTQTHAKKQIIEAVHNSLSDIERRKERIVKEREYAQYLAKSKTWKGKLKIPLIGGIIGFVASRLLK